MARRTSARGAGGRLVSPEAVAAAVGAADLVDIEGRLAAAGAAYRAARQGLYAVVADACAAGLSVRRIAAHSGMPHKTIARVRDGRPHLGNGWRPAIHRSPAAPD